MDRHRDSCFISVLLSACVSGRVKEEFQSVREKNKLTSVLQQSLIAAAFILAMSVPASTAQEPVSAEDMVVSATKIAEPKTEATSEVLVITSEDIERSEAEFLPEVLRKLTEINLIQEGGVGTFAAVGLRGGSPGQTVIMIDGVRVENTLVGYYDISGIKAEDIARIEVVKGPLSAMYGPGAVNGVINIITKRSKPGFTLGGAYETGSFKTRSAEAFVGGGSQGWNFRISGSQYRTDGISIAKDGDEEDAYQNDAYSANLALLLAENVTLDLSRRYYEDENDLDFGSEIDDPNYDSEGEHTLDTGKATVYLAEMWEQILTISKARDFIDITDKDSPSNDAEITSEVDTFDWQHNFYLPQQYVLTMGYERRLEHGEVKKDSDKLDEEIENKAVYVNLKQSTDRVAVSVSGRYDDHETFGDETTYRIGVIENVAANARFRASYGTAFRFPTIIETAENPDLDPEHSTSWELGFEQDLGGAGMFSVTYFEQKYVDMIEQVPDGFGGLVPQNDSGAKVKGVETTLLYRGPAWAAKASHTHLETEDEDGNRLSHWPKDKYFVLLGYYGGSFELSADYAYVNLRYDSAGEEDTLKAYQLVNANAAIKFGTAMKLYARGENITDEDYELAEGFGTPGEAYYFGLKLAF